MAGSVKLEDLFQGAVTVGERGQVVVPAGAREACDISPGDKLLVFLTPDRCGVTFVRLDKVQRIAKLMTALAEAAPPVVPSNKS